MKKSWKTTVVGIIALVVSALLMFGIIDTEQADVLKENSNIIADNIEAIILAVVGVIGLFARDNDKTSEDVGAKK